MVMLSPQVSESPFRRFFYKVEGGFGLAALILIVIGTASYRSLTEFAELSQQVTHTQLVLSKLQGILSDMKDAQRGLRGYIVTGKERFLEPYHRTLKVLDQDRKSLDELTKGTLDQGRRFDAIDSLIAKQLSLLATMMTLRQARDYEPPIVESYMDEEKKIMDQLQDARP